MCLIISIHNKKNCICFILLLICCIKQLIYMAPNLLGSRLYSIANQVEFKSGAVSTIYSYIMQIKCLYT